MTVDMIIVLVVLVGAVILFATELMRVDVVAILIMVTLMVTQILAPHEGLAGFSNSATATVAAMFVLSAAVESTGILNPLAKRMEQAFVRNFWFGFLLMMLVAGFFSAFVNNTPVVALLIPVVIAAASKSRLSPSKILIPLSFVSMFGGVCTLVGTSTNILVSDVADQYGYGAFSMFEMTKLGLIFFATGSLFLILFSKKLLPDYGASTDLDKEFQITQYLTNIALGREAIGNGKRLNEIPFLKKNDIEVIQVRRGTVKYYLPPTDFEVMEHDVLKIRCNVEQIKKLHGKNGIEMRPLISKEVAQHGQEGLRYVEAIVSPGSSLVGRQFKEIDFRGLYHAALLGIRSRDGLFRRLIRHEHIVSGDTLLLAVEKEAIPSLQRNHEDFILISAPDPVTQNPWKGVLALGIIALVILAATLNLTSILVASIVGCLLMLLTRCIDAERAYRAVDWKVIFLLAGAMSFGIAMKKTGLADVIANGMIAVAGDYGPLVLLSMVYLLTSLLTETMSNNATVVLLAPIVISMAVNMGVSPKPFLMAITFAASSSFMTPIGYQTNTMVYAAGNYKFTDFFKIGIWLNIMFWILATIFIPYFFPF